jgi:hypothetical protein
MIIIIISKNTSCIKTHPNRIKSHPNPSEVGREILVGIATRYRRGGPEIGSRWGRDLPQPSKPALGPTQPPVQWASGRFPGDGRGVVLTTHPI